MSLRLMSHCLSLFLLSCCALVPSLLAAPANSRVRPLANGSFESGSMYQVPPFWAEDQERIQGNGFRYSGVIQERNGEALTVPVAGEQMLEIYIAGSLETEHSASIATDLMIGLFEPDRVYEFSFQVGRSDYCEAGDRIAFGGLRANGVEIGRVSGDIMTLTDEVSSGAAGEFYEMVYRMSTVDYPGIVGQEIQAFVGWTHRGEFGKAVLFDDLKLVEIPERNFYGFCLSGLLGATVIARARNRKNRVIHS